MSKIHGETLVDISRQPASRRLARDRCLKQHSVFSDLLDLMMGGGTSVYIATACNLQAVAIAKQKITGLFCKRAL